MPRTRDREQRTVGLAAVVGLVALVVSVTSSVAQAAITHPYQAELSKAVSSGPSSGAGIALPGPVGFAKAMVGDGGHLWLAEILPYAENATRVDEFEPATGKYLGQILEGEGVASLVNGLAVGHSGGEEQVYVGAGSEGKYVLAVYGPSRVLEGVWTGAQTAGGSFTGGGGKTGVLDGVAVDNSKLLGTSGDVYVATREPGFDRVDVLKSEPGGKEGEEVAEITGTCGAPGVCGGGEVIPFRQPDGVAVSGFNGDVLVADGDADECAKGEGECVVDVFEPVEGVPGAYSFLFKLTGPEGGAAFKRVGPLAVNPNNGDIYVADVGSNEVVQFDAKGGYLGRVAGTPLAPGVLHPFSELQSVAVEPSSEALFIGDFDHERDTGVIDAFGGNVVVPDVAVREPPSELSPHGVVLHGVVDTDGAGEAQCEFEYGVSTEYGQRQGCSASVPDSKKEEGEEVEVQSLNVTGLEPDTTYHYRLDASNANGSNTGDCPVDCGQFTTPGPGVSGESATEVTATSVTLSASVTPHGSPTSYFFQYGTGDTSECDARPEGCTEIPAAPGVPLGSGEEPVAVLRHVQSLTPGTQYHYRVVAMSEVTPGRVEEFPGPDKTITTQPAGSPLRIADDRRWELVSPLDKHGAVLESITSSDVVQAAASGATITYPATLPTELGAPGYSELEQVLSTRTSTGGWSSQDIALPHSGAVGTNVGNGNEYRLFSEDLGEAAVYPFGEFTSLAPCLTAGLDSESTPYIRHNTSACGATLGTFTPLLTADNTPAGAKFGATRAAVIIGASPDLGHVVLSSSVPLVAPPHPGEKVVGALYEWVASSGTLSLVSVLPNEKVAPGETRLGSENNAMARGAISSDGSRVVWSEAGGGSHLYLTEFAGHRTVQIDAPEVGCSECAGKAHPVFQLATVDGSRIFFTDTQRLVADAGVLPGRADLYECHVVEEECVLSDVTPVAAGGVSADVQGAVLGVSSDGSQVYFVANGAIGAGAVKGACSGATPAAGARCNLYRVQRGAGGWEEPELVAVLGGEDWPDWKGSPEGLGSLTARVSGNGDFVAFMSDRSLTGFDNRDAVTGAPDQEVFVYDASAKRLTCVSCSRTGARPTGIEAAKLGAGLVGLEATGLWGAGQGIAANVPGWTSFTSNVARYQSRYLSDDGRLFFDSSDALVPQDVNRNVDVYEWEPAGVGTCSEGSSGFSAQSDACVALISSGAALGESGFMDASASGDDVFFLTSGQLVDGDKDTARDLYDAHVCSVAVPCQDEVPSPPACGTADACRAHVSPQPEVFGAPASSTFEGEGNLLPGVAPKPPVLTNRQKLAKALKVCKRKRDRHRRVVCERGARKRFPVRKAVKKSAHRRGR